MTPAYAREPEQQTESMDSLMETVSIKDADLNAEAERLGIPEGQKIRYVVDIKALNEQYQNGAMTRTEYIGAKRELIEQLK